MLKQIATIIFSVFCFAGVSFSAHPLISGDAGTLGKRNYLFETNYDQSNHDSQGTKTTVMKDMGSSASSIDHEERIPQAQNGSIARRPVRPRGRSPIGVRTLRGRR